MSFIFGIFYVLVYGVIGLDESNRNVVSKKVSLKGLAFLFPGK